MMDSGGSTGRLRDQLGVLPPGDMRQALVALSECEEIWRKLFTYRFDNGDLGGHNFGNIFISAVEKITGSTQSAVEMAMKLLQTKGKVIPVTLSNCSLCAKYEDGYIVQGEDLIDSPDRIRGKIKYMFISPEAPANPDALSAIESADYIVFGPGDLYTSIIPNLLLEGVTDALSRSKGKKIYILNLMTKFGQTDSFGAKDHLNEMHRYCGVNMDFVLINSASPTDDLLDWYERSSGSKYIKDDIESSLYPNTSFVREDLLSFSKFEQSLSDRIKRSLIRHDPAKVSQALLKSVFNIH
jgi:uncharacterized cofD-like protein